MNVIVFPSEIKGCQAANPSKSAMQRAVAAALLATGKSIIANPSPSNDCEAALKVAEDLGAEVKRKAGKIEIHSTGIHPEKPAVNCGESGLGIRMFTPVIALADQVIKIEAEGSLLTRPVDFFEAVLPQLGVEVQTTGGKPPMLVKGPLQAENITVDGSLSSQFLTGLLMSFGAVAENKTIRVQDLTSKPYINLTLHIMKHFGVQVETKNMEAFYFGSRQKYSPREYFVEGDWSGAAFLLVAGAVGGKTEVGRLNIQSAQSDIAILEALEKAGAKVNRKATSVVVEKDKLKAFDFDATQCPDLFPPLVALAAVCEGITRITGARRLTYKESNRAVALKEEFGKLGIRIETEGDLMKIYGGTGIKGGKVHSHNDHRIAMVCAVAAVNAAGPVEIEMAEAVNKSYPEFWDHWQKIGGLLKR